MNFETIKYTKKDNIAFITLNRPNALNAINKKMLDELNELIQKIENDDQVSVVVITGEGEKAFCAGADVKEFAKMDVIDALNFSRYGQKIFSSIEKSNKIYIAAVNGYALGGGCELAMACDIRIASKKAVFGQPEVTLGIIPGFGGTQRLAKLVGPSRAKFLIMTGKKVDANTAYTMGLADLVLEDIQFIEEVTKIAKEIADMPDTAIKFAKRVINTGTYNGFENGFEEESKLFSKLFTTKDFRERLNAFLNKKRKK